LRRRGRLSDQTIVKGPGSRNIQLAFEIGTVVHCPPGLSAFPASIPGRGAGFRANAGNERVDEVI
jgi:hypothetical protein